MIKIAIVNDQDEIIGAAEKAEARTKGLRHRLVRIIILNNEGEILLQKRHPKAKDSPNKWDYSVAGHVDEGEDYETAAAREAHEELGLESIKLKPILTFYAEKEQDGEWIRRFNTVFVATTTQIIEPNLDELGGVRWFSRSELEQLLSDQPEAFSTGLLAHYNEIKPFLGAK